MEPKKEIKKREILSIFVILLITVLILILPQIIRTLDENPLIPSENSYYSLRLMNSINDFRYVDPVEKQVVSFNILYLLPFNLSQLAAEAFSILMGVCCVLLIYLILKKQNIDQKNISAIVLLLVVSPIFLYVFTTFNFYVPIILIDLLALFFLIKEKPVISAILFGILPFIDFYGAFLSFVFLAIYLILNHKLLKKYEGFFAFLTFTLLVSAVINFILGYFPHIFSSTSFQLTQFITDIGADIGFSFSMLILFIIGFVLLWEKGWKNIVIYFFMILFLVFSFFSEVLRVYFNFILVIYAGFAFVYLTKRKWSINLIKKITLLLIVCSILFSTTSYISRVIASEPSPALVDGLIFLKQQSLPDEVVLSSPDNGHFIEYFSEREAFLNSETAKYSSDKVAMYDALLVSRSLEKTENILRENKIKYVLIDQNFKKELENKDGLLFLIKNSNKFSRIYGNSKIEIWMYLGKDSDSG